MSVKQKIGCLLLVLFFANGMAKAQTGDCREVVYHLRGGVGAGLQDTCVERNTLYHFVVDTFAATREGYDFLGWSRTDTGSVDYPIGTQWNILMATTLDLYAVWQSNCEDQYWVLRDTVCESYLLTFTGQTYTTSFTYADTLQDVVPGECDSIIDVQVLINHAVQAVDNQIVCDSLRWQDDSLYVQSTLAPSVTFAGAAANGCDSVLTLHLVVNHSVVGGDTLTVCDTLTWIDGITYHADTMVSALLATQHGCDSLRVLSLTVNHSYYQVVNATSCDSFYWPTTAVVYWNDTVTSEHLTSVEGCDSVLSLHLFLGHTFGQHDTVGACENYTWPINGHTYTSNTQYNSLTVKNDGCDSSVSLHLTIYPSMHQYVTPVVCDSFYWTVTGQTYTQSTEVEVPGSTVHGCDSSRTLRLTVYHSKSTNTATTVCDSIYWVPTQHFYYETQWIDYTLHTREGCDSVVHLHLTVNPSYELEIKDSVCEGTLYYFNGGEYHVGGTYFFRNHTRFGCDSNIVLRLKILAPPDLSTQRIYNCNTGVYTVQAFSSSGLCLWSAEPNDPTLSGQENNAVINVRPVVPTQYTVVTDYTSDFHFCPNRTSLLFEPVVHPQARIEVTPEYLTADHLSFEAFDRSSNATWRSWYVDGDYYGGGSSIWVTASMKADSVVVMLKSGSSTCLDTAYHTLYVRHNMLYVPNAFSPGEAENNRFRAFGSGIDSFEMYIYNRGGNLLFSTSQMEEGWDGCDLNGKPCQQGVYVYVIKYTDQTMPRQKKTEKGSVLLLR